MADDLHAGQFAEEVSDLRPLLHSIAYRMLGSVAEAEDVVQEAMLRLHRARTEGTAIESPKAFLAAVTTRLAIDQLRSARVRRETYIGPWLPEPVVEQRGGDVTERAEIAESLSMAFMIMLEALSPLERAVFILREVFDYGYDEIAEIVEKTEANCRQVFVRAKRRLEEGRPRFESSREKRDELAERFFAACRAADLEGLERVLAADVALYGDGGGKAAAARRPVSGRDHVSRFLVGLFTKARLLRGVRLHEVTVNGQPGAMVFDAEDRLINVFALDIAEGKVLCIRSVVNPDKLAHLGPLSPLALLPERRSGDTETKRS